MCVCVCVRACVCVCVCVCTISGEIKAVDYRSTKPEDTVMSMQW